MDETTLSREAKLQLLLQLRAAMKQMHTQLLLRPAQVRAVIPSLDVRAVPHALQQVSL